MKNDKIRVHLHLEENGAYLFFGIKRFIKHGVIKESAVLYQANSTSSGCFGIIQAIHHNTIINDDINTLYMNKEEYIRPDLEVLFINIVGLICQSPMGDTGTGSLEWGGEGGNNPGGSGDDFSWGN